MAGEKHYCWANIINYFFWCSVSIAIGESKLIRSTDTFSENAQLQGFDVQSEGVESTHPLVTSSCAPVVGWSDKNCEIGPVFIGTDVAPSVFRQLCPRSTGRYAKSFKHYGFVAFGT